MNFSNNGAKSNSEPRSTAIESILAKLKKDENLT